MYINTRHSCKSNSNSAAAVSTTSIIMLYSKLVEILHTLDIYYTFHVFRSGTGILSLC